MPEKGLRLVLSFDQETHTFKPNSHNLTAEQAVEHGQKLLDEKITSTISEQSRRHSATNPEQCSPCKKAAAATTEKQNQSHAEQEQAPESAGESEGE